MKKRQQRPWPNTFGSHPLISWAFVTILALVEGFCLSADPVPSVRVVLPADAGVVARRAAGILSRQISERCDAKVLTAGEAAWAIHLGCESGIGPEGYRISDGPGGSVRILGNDERGLLYGVGKFLRSSRYDRGGFTPGTWRGTSVPQCPMRGIYFATHFNNFYEYSPDVADDVVQVVEAFEKNHRREQIGPSAEKTFERVREIEAKLTPRARTAWRWRIVFLRALIDRELFKTQGKLEGRTLQQAFGELTTIYHAEHAHSMPIRPPQIRDAGSQ